jgi:lysyl-tRNA synthetase class 2
LISSPALSTRSRVVQAVRDFFRDEAYLEVDTPVRIPSPANELHIDAVPSGAAFLRTSPELHMKRLLADGLERIYQVGPCFREGESGGLHSPEFALLEWYRTGAGYRDVLDEACRLLRRVADDVLGARTFVFGGRRVDLSAACLCLPVSQAFRDFAGWDPVAAFDADRFDLDLVAKVEPRLPVGRPVALIDYPPALAALARCRPGEPPVAERWELYVAGMELANAFGELTDPVEQRRRFENCRDQRRAMQKAGYPLDEPFLKALEQGLPPCAGVALGVDRLVMLFADEADISAVRPFCRELDPPGDGRPDPG